MSRILSTLQRQLLPLGLITVAAIGILLPRPGQFMAQFPTQYVAVATIFVCSGLLLRTQDLRAALSAWSATVWGCLAILFITPAIGVTLAMQVPVDGSFRLGLALFCCMPTTLSSGIALTGQARGNVALALLLTVLSNALGILTVPFVLAHLLGFLGQVELSAVDLLVKLCVVLLVPLSAGWYLRRFAETWIDQRRSTITTISNLALISVPWMKFSQSSSALLQVALTSLGLVEPLRQFIMEGHPFLGVCMGLQLLFTGTEEGGWHECLGIFPGRVRRFPPGLKIPHMGWNQVKNRNSHPVLNGIADEANFYFVHSYYAEPEDRSIIAGETEYGVDFCSIIARNNLVATQFHPEKSGEVGLKIYDNFLKPALG